MAALHQFDGRRKVQHYTADELETMVAADAVRGLDNAAGCEPFLWWAVQAYGRIAALRRVSVDEAFAQVAVLVTASTGRPWPT